VVACVDQAEGYECDEDLAEDADDQRLPALAHEVSQVGAKTYASEGGKEGPAREVGEAVELTVGEEACGGENRDGDEPEDELGELLPEEEGLVLDGGGLSLGGPVDGVAEDDEAEEGRPRGLGEDGEASGSVAVDGSGDGGFGGVIDGESGPDAVGLLAHVQGVADGREGEESDGAEGEDGGHGGGGVLFAGVDGSLGGHDGGDAADAATDGEYAGEFGRQLEDATEQRHDGEREDQFDGDEDEGHAADVEEVLHEKACADEDDAEFEPELVGGYAGLEDAGDAEGVADDEAEDDGPENVLNVRKRPRGMLGMEDGDGVLEDFAQKTDAEEQRHSRNRRGETRGRGRGRTCSRVG